MRSFPIAMAMALSSLAPAGIAGGATGEPAIEGLPLPAYAAPAGRGASPVDFAAAANEPAPAGSNGDADAWSYEMTDRRATYPHPHVDVASSGVPSPSRPEELVASPMAPLPPGLLIAPVGLATAAWMTYRIKRRRGAI